MLRFSTDVGKFTPGPPGLFLSFLNEVAQVMVGTISQHLKQGEFPLRLIISFDSQALSTVNNVLSHANFDAVLYDIIVKTPSVEFHLAVQLRPVSPL